MLPGDPPTIYDVAERAGVSIATVSRVVNGAENLRDETRHKVQRVIDELGYVPNGSAQGLGRRSTGVLGLVYRRRFGATVPTPVTADRFSRICHDLDERSNQTVIFYDALIRFVEAAAYNHGYAVLLSGVRSFDDHRLVMNLSGKCDAMVLMEAVLTDEHVGQLASKVPVASMSNRYATGAVTNVVADNVTGVRLLADHLIDVHGKRRIAFLSGPPDSEDAALRLATFDQVVGERGIERLDQARWAGDFSSSRGFQVTTAWCESGEGPPDAIMCANDATAFGVLAALREFGLDVPGRIAVTGFDDAAIAHTTVPPLTTVRQPLEAMSRVAVGAVMRAVAGGSRSQPAIVLPTGFMIRESCGCTDRLSTVSPATDGHTNDRELERQR